MNKMAKNSHRQSRASQIIQSRWPTLGSGVDDRSSLTEARAAGGEKL